ncbi:hypothetical protein L8P05_00490 [Enterobacter cloacae]|nr:hypothetical protein [Enterobacter cloacae]MCK7172400.1 hypothetical protein [Enterobacter cloacae]
MIAQNADTGGSKAFLKRIIHIYSDKRGQSIQTRYVAECLEQIPVSQEKTRDAITALAVERCQALKKDHPLVQKFWEMFDYLDVLALHGINHSADEGEIAVNFNHLEEVAAVHRQRIPFTLTEFKMLLKNGNECRYIDTKTTRSAVSERHNRGKGEI